MTTGEGGMLVTDRAEWADKARTLRSHGIVRDPASFTRDDPSPLTLERGSWYYEMQDLGYNYRLTDIQAALGLSQLDRLTAFIDRRREIVAAYNAGLTDVKFLVPPGLRDSRDAATTSWHLYTVQIDFESLGRSRTDVMAELRRRGVGTQVLYIPVYLQPWYRTRYAYAPGKCPHADAFYRRALSLPLYPAMSDSDVEQVIAAVREVLSA